MNSTLYLLPTPLCNEHILAMTAPYNISIINSCSCFIVEELKTARRFFKWQRARDNTIDGRCRDHEHKGTGMPVRFQHLEIDPSNPIRGAYR